MVTTQVTDAIAMIEPSSWLRSDIIVKDQNGVALVKFSKDLHLRLEALLEKRKEGNLTSKEEAEYQGISELERILTFVNAKLLAHHEHS